MILSQSLQAKTYVRALQKTCRVCPTASAAHNSRGIRPQCPSPPVAPATILARSCRGPRSQPPSESSTRPDSARGRSKGPPRDPTCRVEAEKAGLEWPWLDQQALWWMLAGFRSDL